MTTDPPRPVVLERAGATTVLRLSGRKLNAFSTSVLDAFDETLTALEQDPRVRCVVLTGGPKAFSVGARIDELRAMAPQDQAEFNHRLRTAFDRVAALPVPTVAAMHRFALGGGLELSLACTFRIAAPDTELGLPEARLGILPGAGGTQRLPRTIGYAPALRLLLTGRSVSAPRAMELGLIDQIAEDPVTAAEALGAEIGECAPLAVRAILTCARDGRSRSLDAALDGTEAELATLLTSCDATEGLTAFAESRPPRWSAS